MRRLVAFLLDGIPLCASTEKVVAATLADWRHESARGSTSSARVIVGVRSTIALIRALLGCAFQEVPSEARSPFVWRVIVAGLLTVAFFAWLEPQPRWFTTGILDRAWLSVLFAIRFVMLLVLVVVFAAEATGRQDRRGPSLASGVVMSAALFVTMFVVVPEAYNYFAQRTEPHYFWPGLADGRLPPMASPVRLLLGLPTREIPAAYFAVGVLNWAALSLSAWAFAVLACRLRQSASSRRVRRVVTTWSAVVTILVLIVGFRFAQAYSTPLGSAPFFVVQIVVASGALIVASWLNRRGDRGLADQRTADQRTAD